MKEIDISFTEEEMNAIVALIDAALRANGINALSSSYPVMQKIEAARLAYYKSQEQSSK